MAEKCIRVGVRKFAPFEAVLEKLWENYVAATGCDYRMEAITMDLSELYDALFTKGAMKNGEVDIAQVNTDWITGVRAQGALEELSGYISENPPEAYPTGWDPSMLHFQTFGDEVYGLPFHDGPECFIYRKDLFEDSAEQAAYQKRYGNPLVVPQTWDDCLDVAHFFTRPEQNLYGTIFAAYPDRHNNVFDFSLQLWSRGGELMRDGEICLYSPEAVAAMEFYRAILGDSGAVHPNCREYDSIASGMAFARGEVAMMVNWFGFAAMCETIEGSAVQGKVAIANLPHLAESEPLSLNVYYTWSIGTGSRHKEIAYDFIRFCVSKESDRLLPALGAVGCRRSTWRDAGINRTIPYYGKLEELHRYARTFPKLENWREISEVIDELVVEVVNSDRPVREILKQAQERLKK